MPREMNAVLNECPWDEYAMNKLYAPRMKPPGMEDPEMKPPKPIIARDVTYIRMWGGGCPTKGSFIYAFS